MVAELDGVVQQVVEDLLDLAFVRVDFHLIWKQTEARWRSASGVQVPSKEAASVLDHLRECRNWFLVKQKVLCESNSFRVSRSWVRSVRRSVSNENDIQVFLLHFRRDGPVRHGLHISFDGGEGGAEIVGDVGHEFLLVILHILGAGRTCSSGRRRDSPSHPGCEPGSHSPDCRRHTALAASVILRRGR